MICQLVNAFLLFLQHRKIAECEKVSTNFRLNESQKVFLLPAQCFVQIGESIAKKAKLVNETNFKTLNNSISQSIVFDPPH